MTIGMLLFGVLLSFVPLIDGDQLAPPNAEVGTLEHVHVIWRHGDRTPTLVMPNDRENGEATWPEGLGELTPLGVEQQFHLGQLLRRRYDGFLPADFHPTLLHVQSSDRNRTLMSAQANMAGLFPERTDSCTRSPSTPKRSKTTGYSTSFLPSFFIARLQIFNDRVPCPVAEEQERLVYESAAYKQQEQHYNRLLQVLGEAAGFGKVPLPFSDVWKVYDSVLAVFSHPTTHKMPRWVTQELWAELQEAYDHSAFGLYDSPQLVRLRGGPVVEDVVRRMERKVGEQKDVKQQKLFAYSGHDTTIDSFLAAFNIRPPMFAGYAHALMIELHAGKWTAATRSASSTATTRSRTRSSSWRSPSARRAAISSASRRSRTPSSPPTGRRSAGSKRSARSPPALTLSILVLAAVAVLLGLLILSIQVYQMKRQRESFKLSAVP
ncbi:Histidine phosphatase superfamily, clade-2-containing protein [Aphelenchoides fujianensis]|nr:Histidine phosphatase superfamily, clade-2-containing protein [Aphelenchoides fujianensis]